jgi:hypothetical protein
MQTILEAKTVPLAPYSKFSFPKQGGLQQPQLVLWCNRSSGRRGAAMASKTCANMEVRSSHIATS